MVGVALVQEHVALRDALGCAPSVYAFYHFAAKLRAYKPLLDSCIAAVRDRLREANPGMGENIAIDGSDLPAYANGQRFASKNGRERDERRRDVTWVPSVCGALSACACTPTSPSSRNSPARSAGLA